MRRLGAGRAGEFACRAGRLACRVALSFLRRFLIACVIVVVIAGAGVVAGNTVAKKTFDETPTVHIPNLLKADPGKPANYLLIGSDTRDFGETSGEQQA